MIPILPAIDLRGGNAVRLYQGDFDQETVYDQDPVGIARRFESEGASWIHVVDLDGARSGQTVHRNEIETICQQTGLNVEVGGGLRSDAQVEALLDAGVARVVIGTAAVENPDWFAGLVERFPGKIAAGVDARQGLVATHGWESDGGIRVESLVNQMNTVRPAALIFTEIQRDGAMQGPDLNALQDILERAEVPVIASGGISSLDDIANVLDLARHGNLGGIIVGRAVYENAFTVRQAVDLARST